MELFQLSDHLPLAKEVLQEVTGTPKENEILKRLTRRRRRLVNERVRVVNNLQADLQAVCPGLLEITAEASNQWFLNFLSQCRYPAPAGPASKIDVDEDTCGGQKICKRSSRTGRSGRILVTEVEWVGEMIHEDAQRCLELEEKIKALESKIAEVAKDSKIAKIL